jgi:hypothetical protein
MARICRDDLPDGESEIFLQRGIDTKMPDGQISRPVRRNGETDGVARLFIVGERRCASFKLPGCCEPLVGIRLIGRVHLAPRRGIVPEEKERNCKVLLLRENGHLPERLVAADSCGETPHQMQALSPASND